MRSGSSSTSASGRRSSFSRQRDAELGQHDDHADERDEPAVDPLRMPRFAHRRRKRTTEQDHHHPDEPDPDDERRQPDDQALPRWMRRR